MELHGICNILHCEKNHSVVFDIELFEEVIVFSVHTLLH